MSFAVMSSCALIYSRKPVVASLGHEVISKSFNDATAKKHMQFDSLFWRDARVHLQKKHLVSSMSVAKRTK